MDPFLAVLDDVLKTLFLFMSGGAEVDIVRTFFNVFSLSIPGSFLLIMCVFCLVNLWLILSFKKSTFDCDCEVERLGEVETGLVDVTSLRVLLFLEEILLGGAGGYSGAALGTLTLINDGACFLNLTSGSMLVTG